MSASEDQSTKRRNINLNSPVADETQQDRTRRLSTRRMRINRSNSQSERGDAEEWEQIPNWPTKDKTPEIGLTTNQRQQRDDALSKKCKRFKEKHIEEQKELRWKQMPGFPKIASSSERLSQSKRRKSDRDYKLKVDQFKRQHIIRFETDNAELFAAGYFAKPPPITSTNHATDSPMQQNNESSNQYEQPPSSRPPSMKKQRRNDPPSSSSLSLSSSSASSSPPESAEQKHATSSSKNPNRRAEARVLFDDVVDDVERPMQRRTRKLSTKGEEIRQNEQQLNDVFPLSQGSSKSADSDYNSDSQDGGDDNNDDDDDDDDVASNATDDKATDDQSSTSSSEEIKNKNENNERKFQARIKSFHETYLASSSSYRNSSSSGSSSDEEDEDDDENLDNHLTYHSEDEDEDDTDSVVDDDENDDNYVPDDDENRDDDHFLRGISRSRGRSIPRNRNTNSRTRQTISTSRNQDGSDASANREPPVKSIRQWLHEIANHEGLADDFVAPPPMHSHLEAMKCGSKFLEELFMKVKNLYHCPTCKERSLETKKSVKHNAEEDECERCYSDISKYGLYRFGKANKMDPFPYGFHWFIKNLKLSAIEEMLISPVITVFKTYQLP